MSNLLFLIIGFVQMSCILFSLFDQHGWGFVLWNTLMLLWSFKSVYGIDKLDGVY